MKILMRVLLGISITCLLISVAYNPIVELTRFRTGIVAAVYYIYEKDNKYHFYVTLYDSKYEEVGAYSQDFNMIEYEIDRELFKTMPLMQKVTIPKRFKERSLKNFTLSK